MEVVPLHEHAPPCTQRMKGCSNVRAPERKAQAVLQNIRDDHANTKRAGVWGCPTYVGILSGASSVITFAHAFMIRQPIAKIR